MSPKGWLYPNIITCCLPMNLGAGATAIVLETIRKVIETAGGTMADVTFNSIFGYRLEKLRRD